MKHKSTKPLKRTAATVVPRGVPAAKAPRTTRGEDLGDRRLKFLLGTKTPPR